MYISACTAKSGGADTRAFPGHTQSTHEHARSIPRLMPHVISREYSSRNDPEPETWRLAPANALGCNSTYRVIIYGSEGERKMEREQE